MTTINNLCKLAHDNAVARGFYERKRELPELLMLITSELAEAMDAEREGEMVTLGRQPIAEEYANIEHWTPAISDAFNSTMRHTIEEEIADACIRIFDLCGYYGIDLESWIVAKMKYNATREHKHGKAY